MKRRLAAGFVEQAAQHLAINRHDTLAGLGKAGHEPLETVAELLGIEQAEQPAERIVARSACSSLRKPRRNSSLAWANSAMSVQSSPPDSTVHSAIISISSRSCRPALPVRGSSKLSKQAEKPSIVASCGDKPQAVESIRPEPGDSSTGLSSIFHLRFPGSHCH